MLLSSPFEHQPNYLKEEPKNPGKPPRPNRGLNVQAHPNGPRAGPRLKQKSPSPHPIGSCAPFPTQAMDGPSTQDGQPPLKETLPIGALGRTDVTGFDLAGEEQQPHFVGLRAKEPLRDSSVVAFDDGSGSALPPDGMIERQWWTGMPHAETLSVGPGTNSKTYGVAQAGLPPSAPESRTFHHRPHPNKQNRIRNPTIEYGTSASGGSASGGSASGGSASGGLKKNPVCHQPTGSVRFVDPTFTPNVYSNSFEAPLLSGGMS